MDIPQRAEWLARRVQRNLFPNERQREARRWSADGGYLRHRFNYDFTPDSIALDLGGFRGQFAADLFARFCCRVLVFEPVPDFAASIEERFKHNDKIEVFDFGLGGADSELTISLDGAGSSTFKSQSEAQTVQVRALLDFLDEHEIEHVDLLKMNIEGGEYELLDTLLDRGEIARFANIQIQFHDFVPDAEKRMAEIQRRLGDTHRSTFLYKFMMENWERRSPSA